MKSIIVVFLLVFAALPGCAKNAVEEEVSTAVYETAILLHEETAATTEQTEPTELVAAMPVPKEVAAEQEVAAQQITSDYKIFINNVDYTHYLSDNKYKTKRYVRGDQQISVESASAFSGIYIEWDTLPGSYSIVWEGGSIACGEAGFLHEYIRIPEAVNQIVFQFPSADMKVICNISLFTDGIIPDGIQDWLSPCDEADILVFPTHSDDDVLFFGPLISYYAIEEQLKVQTAFMVEHRGYPERNHERLNGLWEMGVRHYPILGTAPDTSEQDLYTALRYYKNSPIEQWQVEQIRRFKPLVLVGHDIEGEYGNGGHKVNTHYLITAVEAASNEKMYEDSAQQYGLWNTPKFYLHLYSENEIIFDVNVQLKNDPLHRTPFEIATDAFKYHTSQHIYGFRVQQNEWRQMDCRPFGLYRSLVGADSTADIMENLDASQWRNKSE